MATTSSPLPESQRSCERLSSRSSVLDRPIRELCLAAIDFETTGLSPRRGDRVIEAAVVRGKLGEIPGEWSRLVNPERPVAATFVHGITDEMVASEPTFRQIAPEFLAQLDGTVLIAHNAPFDLGFLEMECERAGIVWKAPFVIDSLGLSRRVLAWGRHGLGHLAERFGLPGANAHRARDDARATWLLTGILVKTVSEAGEICLGDLLRLCQRRSARENDEIYAALHRARTGGAHLLVDYVSADRPGAATRRSITVLKVTRRECEAFCHLRGAQRTFRLDRLRIVEV